jgi:hypothetical protein
MATLIASRFNEPIRSFYDRLRGAGKTVAALAIARPSPIRNSGSA